MELAVSDIKRATDILHPVYQASGGTDGFISLELSLRLARNAQGPIQQAKELWRAVERQNGMIKIPATKESLTAIYECTCDGINVNINLLFDLVQAGR